MFLGSRGVRRLALGTALVLTSAPILAQQKIGVINAAQVMSESKRGQAAVAKIEAAEDTKRAELSVKNEEVLALQKEFNDGRLSLAEDRLTELQDQIQQKGKDLERAQEDAQQALQKLSETDLRAVERDILATIDQVGKELGYDLIFDMRQSGLVFAADSANITAAVLERFDQNSSD